MERKKTLKDLGTVTGKIIVFGGVYSNLQSLEKLYAITKELSVEPNNVFCTGDIVGYCAQPEETVQFIKNWGIQSIAGNVEIQLREEQADCGCDFSTESRCDVFSRQWYPFAQSKISNVSKEWMHTLPDFITFKFGNKRIGIVHGSYHHTSEFIFKSTPWSIKHQNFEDMGVDIILSGHCGLPFHHVNRNNYWLNPGVIGMPANDGTQRVWYMTLEENKDSVLFHHHSFEYDASMASSLMNEYRLPEAYAKTLINGIWDNCEILPQKETHNQGIRIEF